MKFFSFILSIYVAFLISLPCADNQECEIVYRAEKVMEAKSHQDHSHESESCSPLCICMCCNSYAFVKESKSEVPIKNSESLVVDYPYNQPFISFDYKSIWQPPKIA